ncbi:MAG: protein translocase subunit SecF [Jatrophihabitans sp.]|uniref:protein translocase subunit SecF n=1 Tax=Jatrophihabitans sp. TaxID=1932789 RepID=UPI003F80BE04
MSAPQHQSLVRRLYRGETRFEFIRHRKRWYAFSAVLVLIAILSMIIRGFTYGIEFKGGTEFQIADPNSRLSVSQVQSAFSQAGVTPDSAIQVVGTGSNRQLISQFHTLASSLSEKVKTDVSSTLNAKGNVGYTTFSQSWGHDTTTNALYGLIVFLILTAIFISLRYQWRMAVGAMVALAHDLVIAAGIYSLVGFEVTPSTVVGLLTILGFSLYDTVVVYDKVGENSKDILAGSRMTYSEAANLAVNQTLMRSINTSLISLLPVAGLLFVGAGLLGVGTIKDLALILFVGLAVGAYSSLFLATPVVVDLTEREPAYKALTRRVVAKRASDAKKAADESGELAGATAVGVHRGGGPAPAPRPGARPQRRRR